MCEVNYHLQQRNFYIFRVTLRFKILKLYNNFHVYVCKTLKIYFLFQINNNRKKTFSRKKDII